MTTNGGGFAAADDEEPSEAGHRAGAADAPAPATDTAKSAVPAAGASVTGPAANATLADGVFRPLDPRYVTWRRRRAWIRNGVLLVLAAAAAPVLVMAGGVPAVWPIVGWLLLLSLLAWHAQVWPRVAYEHSSYRITQRGVEIRRGVLVRRLIHVPRSRIQHTDVSQGPIERSLDLGRLAMHTAGTAYALVELPGLPHEQAVRIRAFLIRGAAGDDV